MPITNADQTVMGNLRKKAASKLSTTTLPQGGTIFDTMNNVLNNQIIPAQKFTNSFAEPARPQINGSPIQGPMKANLGTGQLIAPQPVQIIAPEISDAEKYKQMKQAEADQEVSRRRAAAQNLYDSAISNLSGERASIEPMYNETIRAIDEGAFNNSEAKKELMNQYGWGMGDTGLAVGEVNKIGIDAQKSKDKAAIERDNMLADIKRRESLAASLKDNSNADANSWKAAQMMGVDADAFLKAKEMARQDAATKRANMIEDSKLEIQEAGVTGTYKGQKTAAQKQIEDNRAIAQDELFTKNTGVARMSDNMVSQDNPLRGQTDYASVINQIKSNPNWMNDPISRYNIAAATMLRNQKINAMRDSNPDLYNKYKDSINYDGEYINAMPNIQWDKQYQSGENQRTFDNNYKTNTFNENVRANKVNEGFQSRQIGVSEGNLGVNQGELGLKKAAAKLNDANSGVISAAYSDFVTSGKSFDDWLKTPGKNGATYGQALTDKELNSLIGLAKDTGKFSTKSTGNLEDLLKQYGGN